MPTRQAIPRPASIRGVRRDHTTDVQGVGLRLGTNTPPRSYNYPDSGTGGGCQRTAGRMERRGDSPAPSINCAHTS